MTAGSCASTAIRTPPIRISSPPRSSASLAGSPSTSVPFAEPRSRSRSPSPLRHELRVAARGARVADHEVRALDAPEHERAVDLHHAAGVLAGEDLEPHAAAP